MPIGAGKPALWMAAAAHWRFQTWLLKLTGKTGKANGDLLPLFCTDFFIPISSSNQPIKDFSAADTGLKTAFEQKRHKAEPFLTTWLTIINF